MSDPENPYSSTGSAGNYQMSYQAGPSQGQVENNEPAPGPVSVGQGGQSTAAPVKDISTDQFVPDVIEASKSIPVVIDFWAPWCGPCKQLTPTLEKVAAEFSGQISLVKMNTEQFPEVAAQMGIKSIPAVVVFVDGKPADAFMGAQPESEVRKFFEKHAGPAKGLETDKALADARQMIRDDDMAGALNLLMQLLQADPQISAALGLAAGIYLKNGDRQKAEQIFATINEDDHGKPDVAAIKAELELLDQAGDLGEMEQLVDKVKAEPGNFQAKFDLSLAYNIAGERDKAADMLLEIIKADREWQEDGARKQLVKYFESWGEVDDATKSGRRKLSTALFS